MNVHPFAAISKTVTDPIPVCRPLLPSVQRLAPYLARLDESRWYSNYGQLVRELEVRLSGELGQNKVVVTTAASGVSALVGAILATAGQASAERPYALLPAYTFIGTVSAVEQCGYIPYLVDVDPRSWCVEAEMLAGHPMLPRAGLIMPVAAYGRLVEQRPWQRLRDKAGVAVVIDGAAAFETLCDRPDVTLGDIPVAISFQATKVFCTGEGGAVACLDSEILQRSQQSLNFGFVQSRTSTIPGTNGKMSEYHAAVGLAEMDGWAAKRSAYRNVAATYRALAERHGLSDRIFLAPAVGANYALFEAPDVAAADRAMRAMTDRGIGHRLWYGLGLHDQPYLAGKPRDALANTDSLSPRLIGIPVSVDMTQADIDAVVGVLAQASGGNH